MQIKWMNGRGYANICAVRAGLCKYCRRGSGRRWAARGSGDSTGTGTGSRTGRRRGRTGAEPAPLQRRAPAAEPAGVTEEEEPLSRCVSRGGERDPGRTGTRPRSGVAGTGAQESGGRAPSGPSVCPDGAPLRGGRPRASHRPPRRGARAGEVVPAPGRCRCGRSGAPRTGLGTAEPRPPPRRLGMAGYKKPVVCAALGAVIFTRVCAGRNARV